MAASSPPQVGVPIDKASINAKLGAASSSLKKATVQLADLNDWAAAYTAEQLTDLYGFTPEEAALVKSALGEVPPLVDLVDAFAFLNRTWGA
jgi:hypothetical protein